MTTFTQEELQQIDVIKYHIVTQAEKRGDFLEEPVTDKMALQYALGVADIFIKEQYKSQKQGNKQKLKAFLSKK